jgi:hypothetical protein
MIGRQVTAVRKNAAGYVTHLANEGEDWSPRHVEDALVDIELGICNYYVRGPEGTRPIVDAVDTDDRDDKYLRVGGDGATTLLTLPVLPA